MISFARQDLILRPIEKRLYLFADERSEGENKVNILYLYLYPCHVTWIIYINVHFPLARLVHIKLGSDWPCGFRGDV